MGKRLSALPENYVLFDLETTGLSTARDEVIEISAVKVRRGVITEEFSTLVNPHMHIPYGASAVNHIYDDMVKNEPDFRTVLKQFLAFAGNDVLAGHNIAKFDLKFLYRDAEKYFGSTIENDYVDTLHVSMKMLPTLHHYRLVDLAEHYGISQEGAHRALNDCRMNMQVLECLRKEKMPAVHNDMLCPKCGSLLKKRSGRFGEFYGCTGYPECRYTRNIG